MNSKKFSDKFDLTAEDKKNLVLFTNNEIGFSIKKTYPNYIMFKPAKNKKGEDDSIAMVWVGYRYKESQDGLVPIYLRVSKQSKYLMKHYDYNFQDDDSPTKESLEISNSTFSPIELESYGDYFYNIKKDIFIYKGKEIAPEKMIDKIFNSHIKTSHRFNGIFTRSKLRAKNIIIEIIKFLIICTKIVLKYFFGRNLEKKGDDGFQEVFMLSSYKKEDLLPTSPNKITILGFETNITKQSALSLSGLIIILLLLNTYVFNINFERAIMLIDNEIFLLCSVIIGVYIYDYWIPFFLMKLINIYIRLKNKIMFMRIEVN